MFAFYRYAAIRLNEYFARKKEFLDLAVQNTR